MMQRILYIAVQYFRTVIRQNHSINPISFRANHTVNIGRSKLFEQLVRHDLLNIKTISLVFSKQGILFQYFKIIFKIIYNSKLHPVRDCFPTTQKFILRKTLLIFAHECYYNCFIQSLRACLEYCNCALIKETCGFIEKIIFAFDILTIFNDKIRVTIN